MKTLLLGQTTNITNQITLLLADSPFKVNSEHNLTTGSDFLELAKPSSQILENHPIILIALEDKINLEATSLIQDIRKHTRLGKSTAIIVICNSASECIEKAFAAGADDVIVHPVKESDLIERLEQTLEYYKKSGITQDQRQGAQRTKGYISVWVDLNDTGGFISPLVIDFSTTGMMIRLKETVDTETIGIMLHFPQDKKMLKFQAKVVRQIKTNDDLYELGLQFENLSDEDTEALSCMVEIGIFHSQAK